MKFEVKRQFDIVTVAEFNNGYSHIGVDDRCWVILNGGRFSAWIFEEAAEVLKQLPAHPNDYEPYVEFMNEV